MLLVAVLVSFGGYLADAKPGNWNIGSMQLCKHLPLLEYFMKGLKKPLSIKIFYSLYLSFYTSNLFILLFDSKNIRKNVGGRHRIDNLNVYF